METKLNGYIAMYKGKKKDVYAETSYKAQQKAAEFFKAKKAWEITVILCEVNEKEVIHTADF